MYRKRLQGWMKHLDFWILDILCLQAALSIAYMLRNGFESPYLNPDYRNLAVVLILIECAVVTFWQSFQDVLRRGYYIEFAMTVKHVCLTILLTVFYLFVTQQGEDYSRVVLISGAGIYVFLGYFLRLIWKQLLLKKDVNIGRRSLLIISTSEMLESAANTIRSSNLGGFYITGAAVIDRDLKGSSVNGVSVVADKTDVTEYICREWVDEVFVSIPEGDPVPRELIEQILEMGVVAHIRLASASSVLGKKQFVEDIGVCTVLTSSINYATPMQLFFKRMIDIMGGIVGCLITVLLVVILGPIIYIQSPGPIFFKQVRVGRNGRKFKMYKFRSMYMDAEERKKELMEQNRVKDGMMFKLDWDPRIIGSKKLPDGTVKKGIGNYIRDWSLDEFPQFFNVLKGNMSLVGTRPPTVDEWEKYELRHRARLSIKPGVTGLWQVSGRSNITDFEEVVKLDTKYIKEWSMGMDMRILFKTVAVVFSKDGSM